MTLTAAFIYFLYLVNCAQSATENYPSLKDKQPVTISLSNYDVSNAAGESREFFYNLYPNSSIVVSITDVPGDAVFVLLQAHTYFHNVTLSYQLPPTHETSVNGTNVGLWNSEIHPVFYLSYYEDDTVAPVMLAIQAYGHGAPVPGGCNMEFSTEIAPYLHTTYDSATVVISFAAASKPTSVLNWLGLTSEHSCSINATSHTMYRFYVPERNFEVDTYFDALKNMMTVGRIEATAHEVPYMSNAPALRRVFAAYPGTGSAYVVVVRTPSQSAVYVPTFSYACDLRVDDDTCAILGTKFAKVLCAIILFLGIFACFAAHRFFILETLLLGFLAGGLVIYTSTINFSVASDDILTLAVGGGLVVGLILVIIWFFCAIPLIFIILAAMILGFLVAAILVVQVSDYINLTSDINFWIAYICAMLIVPTFLISFEERVNVTTTSIVGAFAVIIPIDYYLGSNLRFLLLNAIRRATVPIFKWAVIDLPFQFTDIILAVCWILLTIAGFYTQCRLIRNRPPFPPPGIGRIRRFYRRVRGPAGARTTLLTPSERTPLLITPPVFVHQN